MGYAVYLSGSTQDKNIGVLNYGTEETRMQVLADMVKHYIEIGGSLIKVYRNSGSMSLDATIRDSNNMHVDAHIALHTNSGGGKGTESYYHYKTDIKGRSLAQLVYDAVAPLTKQADRGIKPDNTLYDDGLAELRETIAPATLIEIMFHDNKIDVMDYLNKANKIAESIAKAVYIYFNLKYGETIDIKKGDRGTMVLDIQTKLNAWLKTLLLDLDSNYGSLTEDIVRLYQYKNGLKIDGIVGQQTKKSLGL